MQRLNQPQQSGHAQAVVAQSGAINGAADMFDAQIGISRKDRIGVRQYQDGGAALFARQASADIADGIDRYISQVKIDKALGDIAGSFRFMECWRGNLLNAERLFYDPVRQALKRLPVPLRIDCLDISFHTLHLSCRTLPAAVALYHS